MTIAFLFGVQFGHVQSLHVDGILGTVVQLAMTMICCGSRLVGRINVYQRFIARNDCRGGRGRLMDGLLHANLVLFPVSTAEIGHGQWLVFIQFAFGFFQQENLVMCVRVVVFRIFPVHVVFFVFQKVHLFIFIKANVFVEVFCFFFQKVQTLVTEIPTTILLKVLSLFRHASHIPRLRRCQSRTISIGWNAVQATRIASTASHIIPTILSSRQQIEARARSRRFARGIVRKGKCRIVGPAVSIQANPRTAANGTSQVFTDFIGGAIGNGHQVTIERLGNVAMPLPISSHIVEANEGITGGRAAGTLRSSWLCPGGGLCRGLCRGRVRSGSTPAAAATASQITLIQGEPLSCTQSIGRTEHAGQTVRHAVIDILDIDEGSLDLHHFARVGCTVATWVTEQPGRSSLETHVAIQLVTAIVRVMVELVELRNLIMTSHHLPHGPNAIDIGVVQIKERVIWTKVSIHLAPNVNVGAGMRRSFQRWSKISKGIKVQNAGSNTSFTDKRRTPSLGIIKKTSQTIELIRHHIVPLKLSLIDASVVARTRGRSKCVGTQDTGLAFTTCIEFPIPIRKGHSTITCHSLQFLFKAPDKPTMPR
mmetsp:Transcript_26097/g.54455  ORF Transcript_26097/g.54455 Transcript_26097/m.54455 type:complete len:594 (+) Transcript_26097:251-2032(+)